jgi:hypothetical protein
MAAAVFCVLVNLKHLFLALGPAVAVFYLRRVFFPK